MNHPALFNPLTLPNRIIMAPLTHSRAEDGHLPGDLMPKHYSTFAESTK